MRAEPASSPAARSTSPADTWARYRDNVARHLIGVSRDLQSRVIRRLYEERGYGNLRPSFGQLLSLVWVEARPLTAIAAELAISKQACSQLANVAERAGYVERETDPQDRRSKLVRLSPHGRALVEDAVRVILECESEYAELVGAAAYTGFTASLAALFQGLGIQTHADPALTAAARQSVGVLPLIAVRIQQQLMEATSARGHDGLKMSHGQVLPLIGPDGARIHELARIQRVSRQAISATSLDLEKLGYLRREPDPRDRRGVVLQLTERGAGLIRDSVASLDGLERSFLEILGDTRLEELQRVARDLYRALHLEEEIFEAGSLPRAAGSDGNDAGSRHGTHEIQHLATRLRRQLGTRDTARLAELLEPRAKRTAP